MGHLAEDTAVRAGDALDCHVGTVWIPVFVHGYISLVVHILGGNLPVCDQAVKPCVICYKTSLAVGSRIAVHAAKFGSCQPWGFVGNYLCVNHLGNVASDGIHSQRRRICLLLRDGSLRYKTQLNERLEAVADTQHQAVPLV